MSEVKKPSPPVLQVHLHLVEPAATGLAARHLGPGLTALTRAGAITGWHFLRKGDRWRLRYQPATADSADAATTAVGMLLEDFRSTGAIARWTPVIYEPETIAFGGGDAMEFAHRLFYRDSHHTLAYLRAVHASEVDDQRRELSVLLGTAMMRGAGLDWYEIGDTWARIAHHRPTAPGTDIGRRLLPSVAVLLQADTGPTSALLTAGHLAFAAPWFAAFTACGRDLRTLADSGRLRRGLRAVLAHHQLFHANRLGLSHDHQALLAHAAATTILEPTQEPS
ncbi:thiopeptide-type bacteriocin biosynthesis protein [Kitasatospora sp. NPDC057541]|uniref:thiopeptide-type bacteriocin biosynthesis protein n=1 Tax=unclassified Kitasatospora TaxID=2633591 RepID=UPI0036B7F3FA